MDDWVLWLVVAVVFGIGEVLTTGFFLAPFAIGALIATVVSAAGAGFVVAGLVFLVISTVALVALRPIAKRHMRLPAQLRTASCEALANELLTTIESLRA